MVQTPCLEELLHDNSRENVAAKAGIILSMFLIGAAIGGVFTGVLCDKFGRSVVMICTILIYSIGTALCAFAQTWEELMILRYDFALLFPTLHDCLFADLSRESGLVVNGVVEQLY